MLGDMSCCEHGPGELSNGCMITIVPLREKVVSYGQEGAVPLVRYMGSGE
jgi:hypothetical protein